MPSNQYQQEESIYNLIPQEKVIPPKPPRYESKFKETAKDELKKVKQDHRTMGYSKEPVPKPNEYLKAHEKEPKLPDPQKTGRINDKIKPSVPDPVKDRPLLGIKTNKNFISQNAVDTIMAVPKKPEKNFVDTRKGDKFKIEPSGLEPVYVKKKTFGTVPTYIIDRNEERSKARAEYEAYMQEYFKKGAMRTMSNEEREAILQGLKKNWDELHHAYQSLSVVIDTLPKKMKKEKIENEMKALEKDIDLLQRHQMIYIAD
ncbi:enkurin [Brachionus plicatilis]|uniref:Enkurin n=1 Tax=Brachionus plicatilis TaxID=10195 RepID=A0A3M7SV27_BRAPC|nr:enkurin [Brachionus plicatilis]